MSSKTPKELAEATAAMALESLRAALAAESVKREKVRALRASEPHWSTRRSDEENELHDMIKQSDAAFRAWREASDAIPT